MPPSLIFVVPFMLWELQIKWRKGCHTTFQHIHQGLCLQQSCWSTVLIVSSNKSEAFGQQPLLSLHQHCRSTCRKLWLPAQSEETNFLSTFLISITLITVWAASSNECCHSTDEPNYCIWGYFQFKVSFSLATFIMYYAVCPTEQYNVIFWHKQVQDISPGRQNQIQWKPLPNLLGDILKIIINWACI